MHLNGNSNDHRWYLLMVLQARLYLQICEWLTNLVPGPASIYKGNKLYATIFWCVIICIPIFLPEADYVNVCDGTNPVGVMYVFAWVFRDFGGSCYIYKRWFHIYLVFYVWSFYWLRPLVDLGSKRLPRGPTWAAVSLSA